MTSGMPRNPALPKIVEAWNRRARLPVRRSAHARTRNTTISSRYMMAMSSMTPTLENSWPRVVPSTALANTSTGMSTLSSRAHMPFSAVIP